MCVCVYLCLPAVGYSYYVCVCCVCECLSVCLPAVCVSVCVCVRERERERERETETERETERETETETADPRVLRSAACTPSHVYTRCQTHRSIHPHTCMRCKKCPLHRIGSFPMNGILAPVLKSTCKQKVAPLLHFVLSSLPLSPSY